MGLVASGSCEPVLHDAISPESILTVNPYQLEHYASNILSFYAMLFRLETLRNQILVKARNVKTTEYLTPLLGT